MNTTPLLFTQEMVTGEDTPPTIVTSVSGTGLMALVRVKSFKMTIFAQVWTCENRYSRVLQEAVELSAMHSEVSEPEDETV